MRLRLAPRSMTLDDLELENNRFSSFRRQYLANSIAVAPLSRSLTFASGIGFLVLIRKLGRPMPK